MGELNLSPRYPEPHQPPAIALLQRGTAPGTGSVREHGSSLLPSEENGRELSLGAPVQGPRTELLRLVPSQGRATRAACSTSSVL